MFRRSARRPRRAPARAARTAAGADNSQRPRPRSADPRTASARRSPDRLARTSRRECVAQRCPPQQPAARAPQKTAHAVPPRSRHRAPARASPAAPSAPPIRTALRRHANEEQTPFIEKSCPRELPRRIPEIASSSAPGESHQTGCANEQPQRGERVYRGELLVPRLVIVPADEWSKREYAVELRPEEQQRAHADHPRSGAR